MTQRWTEALIALNEDIVACEQRFHRQCTRVARMAEHGEVTARDEMLLASYMTSLVLLRKQRDALLAGVRSDA